MSDFTKGEFQVINDTAIFRQTTFIAECKGKFEHTYLAYEVNEANAKELVRRWNAFEEGGIVDGLVEALGHYIDDDECCFDHHGCCQTHGGDPCREANAKAAIAKVS